MSNEDSLSANELDIAARLASYHRKIASMRQARNVLPSDEALAAGSLETPAKGRRRKNLPRSAAEDYRFARQIQRLIQGACAAQALLTLTLAAAAGMFVLCLFVFGFAFGFAASLSRVQRSHALCTVFNIAYLLASAGCPLTLFIALAHAGSAEELRDHINRSHSQPLGVVVTAVLAGIASVLGAILAAYVLARPLVLYRYESVAMDEAAADIKSERLARRGGAHLQIGGFGGEPAMADIEEGGNTPTLEPMDAWFAAGEVGMVAPAAVPKTAAAALNTVVEGAYAPSSAEELFARAKVLNKEGKYKRACELIEEAYALQPKISTALSAANLRLKLGDYEKAIGAYRRVLSLERKRPSAGEEEGGGAEDAAAAAAADAVVRPSERELEMAKRKLGEAEELKRQSAINVSALARPGAVEQRTAGWYAVQLDELSDDLFSESATLYAEHGIALQDGLKEISRHLRATRLLACGQTLRPLEKLLTKACLAPRDEGEREWLTTVRKLLEELRVLTSEVHDALREFDEAGTRGWKPAGESMGVKTEWRSGADGSLWVRMDGELSGASLVHAAAIAHEAELWPRWVPFCTAAETLHALSATERVTYIQFDLTSMMKRGAVLHWSLSDSLVERQSLLLLGASMSDVRPQAAAGVKTADFRAIKVLISPRSPTSCRIRWVTNVDLNAAMPQAMLSMVTKKIAGAIVSLLMREAQKLSTIEAEVASSGAAPAVDNPYLRRISEGGDGFYPHIDSLLRRYFDLFGEEESASEEEEDDDDADAE